MILAQRLRTPAGEIDLVVEKDGLLAIIEVKARPSLAIAAASLSSWTCRAASIRARMSASSCEKGALVVAVDMMFLLCFEKFLLRGDHSLYRHSLIESCFSGIRDPRPWEPGFQ